MINEIKDKTDMLYVINCYRYLTHTPNEATELMYEIEQASRITHTGIINNSSLGLETNAQEIENSNEFAEKTAQSANLPLVFTTYRKGIDININPKVQLEMFVKPVWEK
jgi:DhnA family fructose-bisphosphate aldolase class Ia